MKNPTNYKPRTPIAEALMAFKKAYFSVGVFSMFVNMLMLVPSIYMLQVYDRVLGSRSEMTLLMLTLIMFGMYALMGFLEWTRSRVLVRVGAKLDFNLNERVFNAAFQRNLLQAGQNPSQALQDLGGLRQTLTGAGVIALMDAPWFPIYLAVIFLFSPYLALFAIGGAVILVALAVINEKMAKPPLDAAQRLSIAAGAIANNHLRNAEVIDAMGMFGAVYQRWFAVHRKALSEQALASDRAGLLNSITKFVRISMQSLSLGYGALLVIDGHMTSGMMIASSILVGRMLAPMELLIANWKQLVSARASYQRLTELLEAFPERGKNMTLPRPQGKITLEAASGMAPGTRALIVKGVSLEISAGDVVAVVGPSASGKSSLARMLVGVWPAVSGSVRLDGADIFQWNKDELGPHLGYLPQDIELFDGTVSENIARFGKLDSEKVVQAAMAAGVHELVLRLPQGYDTKLGSAGCVLSGGQRQRIGLARALYGEPSLVVLDEPNSNLDDQGELALVETIKRLKEKGSTVVMITHRLGALAVVDKILVMHEGTAKLFGPRDQVLAALMPNNAQVRPLMHGVPQAARPAPAAGTVAPEGSA